MTELSLESLDSALGVPDRLYIALIRRFDTVEEQNASLVLRFHRDWPNGGFGQVLDNLSDEPLEEYVDAFRAVGLSGPATLVVEASAVWNNGNLSDEELDDLEPLDERYLHLTYGESGDEPDKIEKSLVEYIQTNPESFAIAWRRASEL